MKNGSEKKNSLVFVQFVSEKKVTVLSFKILPLFMVFCFMVKIFFLGKFRKIRTSYSVQFSSKTALTILISLSVLEEERHTQLLAVLVYLGKLDFPRKSMLNIFILFIFYLRCLPFEKIGFSYEDRSFISKHISGTS